MTPEKRAIWNRVLNEAHKAHHGPLRHFCAFPTDLAETDVNSRRNSGAEHFEKETALAASNPLAAAFHAVSPYAHWRDTYKDTNAATDFLEHYACFSLIGEGGAYTSTQIRSFLIYLPSNMTYPWHHHPAEELYLILAGSAVFHRRGEATRQLMANDTSHHKSAQPHALVTIDEPMIAYVVWTGDLNTKPVWT